MRQPSAGTERTEQLYFFIRRPVLAAVISIVIVLLGAFALLQLPINRYPQITPPSVQVSAMYPGATAEDVAEAVAAPIEQQLSGLDGLLYYKSSNASDGTMNLQVYFDLARDQDLAAVDVQNAGQAGRAAAAPGGAPAGDHDHEGADRHPAVASVTSRGSPLRRDLSDQLRQALRRGRAQAAPGRRRRHRLRRRSSSRCFRASIPTAWPSSASPWATSAPRCRSRTPPIRPAGSAGSRRRQGTQLTAAGDDARAGSPTAEQFADIIVRANRTARWSGSRTSARVTLGSQSYDLVGRVNGQPDRRHPAVPAARRQRAQREGGGRRADERAGPELSRRA